MRKNSKLAFLLALVMGTATVFAACDEPYQPYDSTTPAQREEQEMNAVYIQRVEKWKQYIEYDAPEVANTKAKLTQLTEKDTDTVETEIEAQNGSITRITTTTDETAGKVTTKYDVISLETDATILTRTSTKTALKEDDASAKSTWELYALSNPHDSMIEVKKTTYKLREAVGDETVDPKLEANYEAVVTYSYYDALTGTAIAENLEDAAVVRDTYIDIADKTYAMDDDGIVKVFEKGYEYALPSFNEDNEQTVVGSYAPYVYVEQDGYGYRIDEGEPITQQISSDMVMATFPSMDVAVYKDNELVAGYEAKAYHIAGFAILPNGNVYLCEYHEVIDEAAADIVMEDYKFDVVHKVLDIQTGAVSTVENAFVAQNIYTNATKDIKTLLNMNTVNGMDSIHLKDGYVLAEITKYADGALEGNSSYAVLDANTLAIVEELPKIVPAQFGYAGYISEDEILFAVRTPDNSIIRYTANAKTGDLNLFTKDNSKVEQLEEGLVLYNKVVYNTEWNSVWNGDNDHYDTPIVLPNGKLLIKYISDPDHLSTSYYIWELGSAKVETYNDYGYEEPEVRINYTTDNLFSSDHDYGDSNYKIGDNYFALQRNESSTSYWIYYDLEGNKLFDTQTDTDYKTIYEPENASKRVEFKVKTTYSAEEINGLLYVRVREAWTEDRRYGYETDEQPTIEKGTYYQYYVVK